MLAGVGIYRNYMGLEREFQQGSRLFSLGEVRTAILSGMKL